MAEATDQQVQQWANERTRVRSEQVRGLLHACEDDNAAIVSVYERLVGSGGWSDGRTDGPPNLLTGADLLAFNTFSVQLATLLRNGGTSGSLTDQQRIDAVKAMADQLPVVLNACVRPLPNA